LGIKIARGALIAAIYIVLCLALQPISYGVIQVRFAESLTLLPMIFPEAIPGLFIGALVANVIGPFGIIDVLGGSFTTLVAAYFTYRFKDTWFGYLSPVLFNAIFVSLYLHAFFDWPYWATVVSMGISEALVVFTLGYFLVKALRNFIKTGRFH
jgi:uncharacterized membrane protein